MFRIIQLPAVLAALGILMAFPGAAEDTRAAGKSERVQVVFSKGTGGRLDVGFNAQGRELRLQLVPNPRLQRWAAGSRWHQYQGALQGVPDSWARLAVAGESMRGAIFDGRELLLVEPGQGAEAEILRLADANLGRDISLAGDSLAVPSQQQAKVGPLAAARVQGLTADRKLEVSALGDASFRARYASEADARDAILTRLNIVDGIFSAQVGVGVEVASINVGDALGAALDVSTDPPILLDSLGRLRQQTTALNDRGLTHLFTGRNLDADSVGIAYSASLCSQRYSASLAQAHDGATIDGLISAHEIGHVFGAPHDGDGQCAATSQTQFIMAPVLNGQATLFSQCSLEQMAPRVENASCLRPLLPPDMALPASLGEQNAAAGTNYDWRVEVQNQGERIATDARVTVEITPALTLVSATAAGGNCVVQTSLATCDLASVNAGDAVTLQVTLRSSSAGTYSAHAQVVTPDDTNRSNDTSVGSLVVGTTASPPAPAPAPSGRKGGGGALDRALLALLAASLGCALRRRRGLQSIAP
jgi:hypothetical protein